VETLRCPTCLGVLPDGGQKRCPSCRTRLGTRGRPIVLGESNRLAAQPVLPIEWELRKRVEAETAAHQDRAHSPKRPSGPERRRPAKSGEVDPITAPAPPAAEPVATVPQRAPHARRARRLVAAKPRVDELPRFDTKIVFVPEAVEALVLEPEPEPEVEVEVEARVGEPPVAAASVVETKIVFVPEAVEAVVAPHDQPEPEAGLEEEPILDLIAEAETEAREIVVPEVVVGDVVAASPEDSPDADSQLFSTAARKPRVKKIAKRRRRWVVDYVVPESESGDAKA
jgi:hypothetical protein